MELRENEIILFQGDSITDGNRGRNDDLNHIMGHGYQYIVGAKLMADNLEKNISLVNRGVSGNRISDLYARWIEDAINVKPTILSVLIGVNDAWWACDKNSGSNAERFEKIYKLMLDEILEDNQKLKIVLMEPFVGDSFDNQERYMFFRRHTQESSKIVKKISDEYNAVFVPLQDMFDEMSKVKSSKSLIWDGVHPTILGHELIARKWLECVEKRLDI